MNILFFDTETTGLPKDWKAPVSEVDNWPRIIQLAYEVCDSETGKAFAKGKTLIKPDGWMVPVADFWIQHGYSTEGCEEHGIPVTEAIEKMMNAITAFDVNIMVAHNMAFDSKVLGAEMIRKSMTSTRKLQRICTMQETIQLCQLPSKYGFKFPRLEELHQFLFNKAFDGAHDAGADVAACRVCFFELVKRGVINLPKLETA